MPKSKKKKNDSQQTLIEIEEKPFGAKLVLLNYICSLFGSNSFKDLSQGFNKKWSFQEDELVEEKVLEALKSKLVQIAPINLDDLIRYDYNINKYTLEIKSQREGFVGWKYFQYIALLFTEIYLDLYMKNESELLRNLQEFQEGFNERLLSKERIKVYEKADLNKLAFWNATGSGKTLIMHVNIKQYQHYHEKYNRKKLDHILLLTPNAALSEQHLQELHLSGIPAELFKIDGNRSLSNYVEVLDIYKLEETKGPTTIAVESLEGYNLVLVDEGHRGSSGDKWMKMRDKISINGFSFEYSATFGQAIGKNTDLYNQYAKCILFDYSYQYFYSDGYGKDFRILNMQEKSTEEKVYQYLTACLLTYYEQKIFFIHNKEEINPLNLENPLLVFVGSTVLKEGKNKNEKDTVSDVVYTLKFIEEIITNKKRTIKAIQTILSKSTGILNSKNEDIFSNSFVYLKTRQLSYEEIYLDMLEKIFHCKVSEANLHIDSLKGISGEIGLRAGDNEYFGVINIGEASTFIKLCEQHNILTSEKSFSTSLFQNINQKESKINILIGSKKFTEGWNSWRVSCMGLLNIGQNEGTQIIQLFGRGVRLKGFNHSLKRTSGLNMNGLHLEIPAEIDILETLNIFGIRANYIQKFKEYLENEGLSDIDSEAVITIPVIPKDYPDKFGDLKIIALKKEAVFSQNRVIYLESAKKKFKENLSKRPVYVNWYTKLQGFQSKEIADSAVAVDLEVNNFQELHCCFLDFDKLYFELINYKKLKKWSNLIIDKENLKEILLDSSWYILYIPSYEFNFQVKDKEIVWQEIALQLLQKYISRFYYHHRGSYEADKREYIKLKDYKKKTKDEGNLIKEYKIRVKEREEELYNYLKNLESQIEENKAQKFKKDNFEIIPIMFDRHLYKPVFYHNVDKVLLHISPFSLQESEYKFMHDLEIFYQQKKDILNGKEIYLLRNMSRGHGLGFFEAGNFYPDFILWVIDKKKQYINFIDPKGIIEIPYNDPKVQFYKDIKEIERELDNVNVILNSFILSISKYSDLRVDKWKSFSQEEIEEFNVLFMEEDYESLYIQKMIAKILPDYPLPRIYKKNTQGEMKFDEKANMAT